MVREITPRTRRTNNLYSDFRKDFIANLVNSDLARKTDEDAVKESIRNLVLTDRGERLFQPSVGCDVRRQLFNNFTPQTKLSIENNIRSTIEQYEPRCQLISVNAQAKDDDNAVLITIIFRIINIPNQLVLDIVLERAR